MNWAPSVVELSARSIQAKDGEGLQEAVHVNSVPGWKFGPSGDTSTLIGSSVFIYLFIYCHLYSAFSIVQCSNALYRLWDGEI